MSRHCRVARSQHAVNFRWPPPAVARSAPKHSGILGALFTFFFERLSPPALWPVLFLLPCGRPMTLRQEYICHCCWIRRDCWIQAIGSGVSVGSDVVGSGVVGSDVVGATVGSGVLLESQSLELLLALESRLDLSILR